MENLNIRILCILLKTTSNFKWNKLSQFLVSFLSVVQAFSACSFNDKSKLKIKFMRAQCEVFQRNYYSTKNHTHTHTQS